MSQACACAVTSITICWRESIGSVTAAVFCTGPKSALIDVAVCVTVSFDGSVISALPTLTMVSVVLRCTEFGLAKPARDMLYTVVSPAAKYQSKNVIDTVVYRGGDLCAAWAATPVLVNFGGSGLAVLGVVVSLIWFPVAWTLGRRYESARAEAPAGTVQSAPGH